MDRCVYVQEYPEREFSAETACNLRLHSRSVTLTDMECIQTVGWAEKRPLSPGESSFQGGKTGLFQKRRARQRRARRPLNQLASANEDSDEEADAADSRADRMTADVLWITSRLSVRRAALPWYR
jgi:hypothetical protein